MLKLLRNFYRLLTLDKEAEDLKKELLTAAGQKKVKAIKKLEVVEAFRNMATDLNG